MVSTSTRFKSKSLKTSENLLNDYRKDRIANSIFNLPRGFLVIHTLFHFEKTGESSVGSCREDLFKSLESLNISCPSEGAVGKCIRNLKSSGYLRPIAPRWYRLSESGKEYLENISSFLSLFVV